jgi:hypothetical protein
MPDLGSHPLNLLSFGEPGWTQIVNFVLAGALAVAGAVGMRRAAFPPGRHLGIGAGRGVRRRPGSPAKRDWRPLGRSSHSARGGDQRAVLLAGAFPDRAWRDAGDAFEGAAERGLGSVAEPVGELGHRGALVLQRG